MKQVKPDEISIRLNIKGADRYEKVSFPIRYGVYSEIQTDDYLFQFNLNGEIKYISGRNTFQIEPTEWIKRTQANDWVFYSSGGYNGAIRTVGEHYVPCFTYQSNAVTGGDPFKNGFLESAISAFSSLQSVLGHYKPKPDDKVMSEFIKTVLNNNTDVLSQRTIKFHTITDGPVSVLPPDTRHVDYDVVPVNIAEGCLYNCKFCSVKTGHKFRKKEKIEISHQIELLKYYYHDDIKNYNSIFLGQHDALHAGADLIEFTTLTALKTLKLDTGNLKTPRLFLFGSADSLIKTTDKDYSKINRLPFETYINIGFESFDAETLSRIGKPVSAEKMRRAFQKMLDVNKRYNRIEITANILIGKDLPESHYTSFADAVQKIPLGNFGRGAIYISPLENDFHRKDILDRFKIMKRQSRLPAFLYLIQRL